MEDMRLLGVAKPDMLTRVRLGQKSCSLCVVRILNFPIESSAAKQLSACNLCCIKAWS